MATLTLCEVCLNIVACERGVFAFAFAVPLGQSPCGLREDGRRAALAALGLWREERPSLAEGEKEKATRGRGGRQKTFARYSLFIAIARSGRHMRSFS